MVVINPERHRVSDDNPINLLECDTSFAPGGLVKGLARRILKTNIKRIGELQEVMYAESKQALLIVLQAMDTGGKDSTIRKLTTGINPQGVRVYGFKAPSKNELARDYLWRVHHQVPKKGMIGIFNRSHYEDVLIVRVHGWASPEVIDQRYRQINDFERLLHESGTRVVKIMLHISKDYQLERLKRRLERPEKHWKFNPDDLKERARWAEYMDAFQVAVDRCSTPYAPWYVIPAERRWYRDAVISQLVVNTLEDMAPAFPPPSFDPSEFTPDTIQ